MSGWLRRRKPGRRAPGARRILEITNVDFAMKQFLHPLMQALREAGHSVEGAAPKVSISRRCVTTDLSFILSQWRGPFRPWLSSVR